MINELIVSALSGIGVPVSFQISNENTYPHITFFIYDEMGTAWGDNNEEQTTYYVQIDVWSKTNYTNLVNSVVERMKEANFIRTYAIDLWEDETKTYHKSIRFSYSKQNLEGGI